MTQKRAGVCPVPVNGPPPPLKLVCSRTRPQAHRPRAQMFLCSYGPSVAVGRMHGSQKSAMDGKDSWFSSRILSLEAPFGRPAKSRIVPSADSSQSTEVQTFPFSAVLRISPIDVQFTMLELVSPTLQITRYSSIQISKRTYTPPIKPKHCT